MAKIKLTRLNKEKHLPKNGQYKGNLSFDFKKRDKNTKRMVSKLRKNKIKKQKIYDQNMKAFNNNVDLFDWGGGA